MEKLSAGTKVYATHRGEFRKQTTHGEFVKASALGTIGYVKTKHEGVLSFYMSNITPKEESSGH